MKHFNIAENLPHLFNQFTRWEKRYRDYSFSNKHFFSVIIKFVNFQSIFRQLLLNLPIIKRL